MSKYRRKLEILDATQLLYNITIHHPATKDSDEWDSQAKTGEWLITYNNGVQRTMSDQEFKQDWEPIGSGI